MELADLAIESVYLAVKFSGVSGVEAVGSDVGVAGVADIAAKRA